MKSPNFSIVKQAIRKNMWPMSNKAAKSLQTAFE